MSPLTILGVIAVYFTALYLISRVASRKADNATFFTGGRRTPWPLVAIAMAGAVMSGVSFVSVPGMVAAKGYSYLQMCLGFMVGYLVIASVLLPLFYKRGLVSIYGYLDERFGLRAYRSGAAMFFISEILGASVRFFVVCATLQVLVFGPLGVPFEVNVVMAIALIWLYTERGGVKSLIWTDILKSICLIGSVVLSIWFIASGMGLGLRGVVDLVRTHPSTAVFHTSDPMSALYFWKQFSAGIFMVVVMNGLNQDMMQRHMACRNWRASAKNMLLSGMVQMGVIAMFLVLGTLLLAYASHTAMAMPAKSDELFGSVATHSGLPAVVGVLFVLGLISAAYSAAGSAITSLTTTVTIDLLDGHRRAGGSAERLGCLRRRVHMAMSGIMAVVIVVFYRLGTDDAISAVYTLASYTYGPILGLFAYGLCTTHRPSDRWVPAVCFLSPLLSWAISRWLWVCAGYEMGFELLLLNGAITFVSLHCLALKSYVKKPV